MLKSCDHIKILNNATVELTFAACEDLRGIADVEKRERGQKE